MIEHKYRSLNIPLDLRSLTTSAVAQPAKYLTCLPCTEFESDRRLSFQPSNRASEFQHRFRFVHLLTLVDKILKPVVGGFDLACHMREFESNDGVVDKLFPESTALMGILHRLFITDSRKADALDDDSNPFVIEVCHHH